MELGPANAEHVLRAHAADRSTARATSKSTVKDLLAQLDAIEEAGGNGALALPEGHRLPVTTEGLRHR